MQRFFFVFALAILLPSESMFAQNADSSFIPTDARAGLKDDIRPDDVIHWQTVSGGISQDRKTIEIGLRLSTEHNFTIYSKRLNFSGSGGMMPVDIKAPTTKTILDPITQEKAEVFSGGEFIVRFESASEYTSNFFETSVEFTGCTEIICLFPHTIKLTSELTPLEVSPASAANKDAQISSEATSNNGGSSLESWILDGFRQQGTPFWLVLILVFFGGLVSNLTPCVYPMIPITIRILSNTGHPLWFAFCYGTGIVVTYTGLGVFAGLTGSMFGKFMQNPAVNLAFAALMALLALGMLGFGNFGTLQAIGSRIGAGKPSARNTLLMGMGAGLVAAPCTGPIMLALLSYAAAKGSLIESILIFLVYSSGFAIPYVFLGASSAKISKRSFSHHVQVGVKIIFASVIFGLALYYLRIPFYQQMVGLESYWTILAIGLGIIGLILSIVFVLRPNLENDKRALVIPSLILGLALFSSYKSFSGASGILQWHKTEASGFEAALKSGKPIFVDGWAEWCLACIEMDKTTFVDPKVVDELKNNWVIIKLDLTESSDSNDQIIESYKFQGLPSYALLLAGNKDEKMKVLAGKMEPQVLLDELAKFRRENR
jgi:thiol:disulfide interchange protein DsbD